MNVASLAAIATRLHGTEIRAGRIARGLTQAAVAAAVGARLATYRKWEYGARECPGATREALAGLLGLDRGRLGLDPENACPCCGQPYA